MKKIVLLFLITAVSLSVFSQEDFDEEDRKGNFIFEPYIGITNAAATIFEQENQNDYSNLIYTNKSMPVELGFKMEYMLTYNIGIGIDFNYEQAGFSL
jgi:outer membrane protein W